MLNLRASIRAIMGGRTVEAVRNRFDTEARNYLTSPLETFALLVRARDRRCAQLIQQRAVN